MLKYHYSDKKLPEKKHFEKKISGRIDTSDTSTGNKGRYSS